MRIITRDLAVAVTLLAGSCLAPEGADFSCQMVISSEPVGSKPHRLVEEEWNGVWKSSDEPMCRLRVLDPEAGILEWVLLEDETMSPDEGVPIHLMEHGDWVFGNAAFTMGDDPEELYFLMRVWKKDDQIILWGPIREEFLRLVTDGILPGEIIDDGTVCLGPLSNEDLNLITTNAHGALFDMEQPAAMIRIEK